MCAWAHATAAASSSSETSSTRRDGDTRACQSDSASHISRCRDETLVEQRLPYEAVGSELRKRRTTSATSVSSERRSGPAGARDGRPTRARARSTASPPIPVLAGRAREVRAERPLAGRASSGRSCGGGYGERLLPRSGAAGACRLLRPCRERDRRALVRRRWPARAGVGSRPRPDRRRVAEAVSLRGGGSRLPAPRHLARDPSGATGKRSET
jgi:hypothetical protein